jgi:phosphate:Na+ symporter
MLLQWLLPQRADPHDPACPQYLDESAREVPAVALGQAAREALRLTDLLRESLRLTGLALEHDDPRAISQARYLNGTISQLDRSITAYLATQDQESLNTDDTRYLKSILTFSMNIAHAADIAGMGLLGHAGRLHKKRWTLDPEQQTELRGVVERLQRNLRQAAVLFVSGDRTTARALAAEKESFRDLETAAAERHLERIKTGRIDAADVGAFYLEILRDAAGVNACLVSAAAYPVLDRYGELRPNRLRESA